MKEQLDELNRLSGNVDRTFALYVAATRICFEDNYQSPLLKDKKRKMKIDWVVALDEFNFFVP